MVRRVSYGDSYVCSPSIHIDAPSPVCSIYEHHHGEDISEVGGDIREYIRPGQERDAESKIKDGHGASDDQHRVAEEAAVADTFVSSGHERVFEGGNRLQWRISFKY